MGAAIKERLILVERFEELRAGMIVVCKPCRQCGGQHRTMLISRYRGEAIRPLTGEIVSEAFAWTIAPVSSCLPRNPNGEVWSKRLVERRALYRVDDGLESLDRLEKSRSTPKPERVR